MRELEDAKFYNPLNKDPTARNNATIREAVKPLRNQGVINDKTAGDLVETKAKCPHFYTLPKIHKNAEAPPGRLIVSSVRVLTERFSAFVDMVLEPFLKSLPSYIKDTKDFLVKGEVQAICRFWVFDGNGLLGQRLIDSSWFEKILQRKVVENGVRKKNAHVPVFRAEMLVTQYVLSSSRHLVTPLFYVHFCVWLGLFVDR